MTPFCAAVDWGTSSFRLWLLAEDGTVLAERRSAEGMTSAAGTGFDTVLESHLGALGVDAVLPAVICGMAGARQGWREAGYLDTPADLASSERDALVLEAYPRDVRILPGIAQRDPASPDVMRGEETQLAGLVAAGVTSGLVCMPGTHSKWVKLQDGKVVSFATYMTGELFGVLAQHSILKNAVGEAQAAPSDPSFLNAVKASLAAPHAFANGLFAVRASQLLGFAPVSEGAARLSGLAIGLELSGALARYGRVERVVLVGEGRLGESYKAALEAIGIAVDHRNADEAVRRGLLGAARIFWA
jgi:2-dehydro-3-deoxygalactonokinase